MVSAPQPGTRRPMGREHGGVRLPDPPGRATDLQTALDALAERFAEAEG